VTGKTISHYRILEKVGEGGMGVVYRAEDTRLDRLVALKFLSSNLLESAGAKERFVREAKAAATLDHPNICTVYEIDEVDGATFLAMAFIDGPTLKQKIEERPLKLKDALDVAIQIGEGLAAAHRRGIVHRDIKPANLMIDSSGRAQIMDFGLARLGDSTTFTKTGVVLGTPYYMAPEQLSGEPVDKRTDIWSFGVVLHEMIAGRPPFEADTPKQLGNIILHSEPEPLTALRSGVPIDLDRIVAKTLAKDPEERYLMVDEAVVDLRALRKRLPESTRTQTAPVLSQPTGKSSPLPWVIAALAVLVALAFALGGLFQSGPEAPLRRLAVVPPVSVGGGEANFDSFLAISPNGRHIAYVGGGRLWVQDLDQRQPRAIEGVEEARSPFWSADSALIGFAVESELRKVPVQGGTSSRVCELPGAHLHGGTWSSDGEVIVFSSGPAGAPHNLYEVPALGGTPRLVISPGEDENLSGSINWARFLPAEAGARTLIFTFGSFSDETIAVENLSTGERRILGSGAAPVYSPSGHLIFQSSRANNDLWALPFSLRSLRATGDAFPIAENARYASVSTDGTLVYRDVYGTGERKLVWVDRNGSTVSELGVSAESLDTPALSPDERFVAFWSSEGADVDVWVYDTERRSRTRLSTSTEPDVRPVWSSDGQNVAFSSVRGGNYDIFVRQADGATPEQQLTATPQTELLSDWSRDGRYILYHTGGNPDTGDDLWYLERSADGSAWEPHPFLVAPGDQVMSKISPDGNHVLFVSYESGQAEIYIRSFPQGDRQWKVSTNGGEKPRWSPTEDEVYYVEGDNSLMAVPVSARGELTVGTPAELFQHAGLTPGDPYPPYDVSADGQRFLIPEPVSQETARPTIRVVENWFSEFRDR